MIRFKLECIIIENIGKKNKHTASRSIVLALSA